jgi:hypothetical protein
MPDMNVNRGKIRAVSNMGGTRQISGTEELKWQTKRSNIDLMQV